MNRDRGDIVADAVLDTWRYLMAAHPTGWMTGDDGVAAFATGIPLAGLNGVLAVERDPDPESVRRLLDTLARKGLPHMLQLRPGAGLDVIESAEVLGMSPDEDIPLMRLDDAAGLDDAQKRVGIAVRQLQPEEASIHALIAAAGFEAPPDHFVRLVPPDLLEAEGVRAYVGEVRGEVVTTALGLTRGDYVAVFNVGTPEAHRRRGYGAAITAHTVADGLAAGASWAWLQSSSAGYGIYEALGFETVERWRCWVRA